ncbi:hypothetical protein [Streptomyces sp. NPDC006285]|uniref:hypothetical protein n=1 Tax=Streptomyces sp. NPDC006285 TaxID=3364742 RepID=UPI0036B81CD0
MTSGPVTDGPRRPVADVPVADHGTRAPLPVRGATASSPESESASEPQSGGGRGPTKAPPFVFPMLSAEQLAADQPSVDMLRRVHRGLTALPEPD